MSSKAVIVVDMQNDFVTGSLAVPGAAATEFLMAVFGYAQKAKNIVYTRDWHPFDHVSFDQNPRFEDKSWPPHCVRGTDGAELAVPRVAMPDVLVSKGTDSSREAYSGFDGDVNLGGWLRARQIREVEVCGLALDYCVLATALDAKTLGLDVTVLMDLTLPVAEKTGIEAKARLRDAGVRLATCDGTPV